MGRDANKLLLQLFVVWTFLLNSCCVVALSQVRRKFRSSGYFTKDIDIPALPSTNSKYGSSIPVCYTNSPQSTSAWFEQHIPSDGATVGFDVESVPNAPWLKVSFQGPATVQVAVPDAAIVVQLVDGTGHPSDASVEVLQALLANKSIITAGVGIDQDMLELFREWGRECNIKGRFDIGGIGSERGNTVSLKNLAGAILGVEMKKSKKLAISDWGKVPLKDVQVAYAARDAWAAAAIMSELRELDVDRFSTVAIKNLLQEEIDMTTLDERATERKANKVRLGNILGSRETRIDRRDLPEDQQLVVRELEDVIRDLAPPRNFLFDVESLGISF